MRWQGGKGRILKPLLEVLQPLCEGATAYYEPFLGGCNVLPFIHHHDKIGNDIEPAAIAFYKYVQQGGAPLAYSPTKARYDLAKFSIQNNTELFMPLWEAFYIDRVSSYVGKYLGGWVEEKHQVKRRTELFDINLSNTTLYCGSYDSIEYKAGSLIYCDPPYVNTLGYASKFDHEGFYLWAHKQAEQSMVIISESWMPEELFTEIATIAYLHNGGSFRAVRSEKLFIPK